MNLGLLLSLAGLPLFAQPLSTSAAQPLVSSATAIPSFLALPSTAPVTAALVLKGFERLDLALKTVRADFSQQLRWEGSGATQRVAGKFYYQAPQLFRIEQSSPEAQVTVSDGRHLWVWRVSTNQVIKTRVDVWRKSEPLAQNLLDLGHYASLLSRYDLVRATSAPAGDGGRDIEIELKPKETKSSFLLTLWLSGRDFFPHDCDLSVGDLAVHSRFSDVRFNEALPESLFRFRPPPDAEVFDNPALPGVVNH